MSATEWDVELPGLEGLAAPRTLTKPRPAPAPVHRKTCPSCSRMVGLIVEGGHLVWKVHHRRTEGGAWIMCHPSGQPVCETSASGRIRCLCVPAGES